MSDVKVGNYHIRDNWKLWKGIELEGRLFGIETLFVGDASTLNVSFALSQQNYSHIYFNPVFITKNRLLYIENLISKGKLVTCSVTPSVFEIIKQSDIIMNKAHIMLIFDLGFDLDELKQTDTIRIHSSKDDMMKNYTFQASSLVKTEDDRYSEDIPVFCLGDTENT